MPQLYTDENFPLPTVDALRQFGHDVITLAEAGHANQSVPDVDVLALAVAAGRIVLTLNRKHFIRLHQTTPTHPGMIVCTFDPDFVALAQRIDAILASYSNMNNQLIRVNRQA
ncbi:MAG: DUF5615 family PIN-like protein [Chloroflexota bacterium]|nr:DUF5615 family PIN-like protein [Chloroflexota bacterium]PLS76879.1 MAG: hypothetical protein CYG59_26810 [Chloroflexota bacterium]